jgi:hypothetical protein
MNMDELEKCLAAQSFRPPPPAWRAQILRQARLAAESQAGPVPATFPAGEMQPAQVEARSRAERLRLALRELFQPCPRGWAGVGAAWVLIICLNYLADKPVEGDVADRGGPTANMALSYLENQHRMLELLNSESAEPADRPKKSPGPRSNSKPVAAQV